jgi:hypothetical protein
MAKLYAKELMDEGFHSLERAEMLAEAFLKLHDALCHCDQDNLKLFLSKPLTKRLADLARIEKIHDVTK